MSDCLEPRRVSVRDIPHWARESWQLLWRRPLGFIAASLVYHGLALSSHSIPWLALLLSILLCYMLLLAVIVGAEAADNHRALGAARIYAMLRRVVVSLSLLSAFYLCIFVVAAVLTALLLPQAADGEQAARQQLAVLRWIEPGELSFMILFMGTIVTSTWFLAPLLALHDLGLRDARVLARKAFDKNDIVVLVATNVPFFGILGCALISEVSVALSLLLVPLIAIFQYVSYRHVFLGRRENAPVPAKAAVGETAFN
jgi:hypothetical protein